MSVLQLLDTQLKTEVELRTVKVCEAWNHT